MANRIRNGVFHSVVGFGLLFTTPLIAAADVDSPRVVDARGTFVGWPRSSDFFDPNIGTVSVSGVALKVNGVWVVIPADQGGFSVAVASRAGTTDFSFFFTSPNCTGTKYLAASELPPPGRLVTNTQLLFPGTPVQLITIGSFKLQSDQVCHAAAAGQIWVGPAQSFNLNNLGLVPPFTVK